ncbi:hypothetical protein [Burkholderia vietnamiensis]|uniref:hypothetical protein n=1 Tax=Burkholderia vietnamiensis TaxID=60552 RepID=UPI001CF128D3|nr:hypothetical protein [Burkholderia vietnamiensis]MCA8292111.1 hypothetical protein [Burkholderia vietnamiensis]
MSEDTQKPTCGIVMPISTIDGCNEAHWIEVFSIVSDAVSTAGFSANMVSDADHVGIIQKRIIQNLYDNPIVVCDVSGKNPNVMFELGMRLAFDKPTIIIKDDKTSYSFDTSPIEHIEYPRDLRFSKIVEFKAKLAEKIVATHSQAQADNNYTTFLKHFGQFKVAKIDQHEVSGQEFILDELRSIQSAIRRMEIKGNLSRHEQDLAVWSKNVRPMQFRLPLSVMDNPKVKELISEISEFPSTNVSFRSDDSETEEVVITTSLRESIVRVEKMMDLIAKLTKRSAA